MLSRIETPVRELTPGAVIQVEAGGGLTSISTTHTDEKNAKLSLVWKAKNAKCSDGRDNRDQIMFGKGDFREK